MTIILIIMAIALPLGIESRANCSDIEKMAKCINKEERERCIELNGGQLVVHEENLTNLIENLAYNCTQRCWKQHCFGPPKRQGAAFWAVILPLVGLVIGASELSKHYGKKMAMPLQDMGSNQQTKEIPEEIREASPDAITNIPSPIDIEIATEVPIHIHDDEGDKEDEEEEDKDEKDEEEEDEEEEDDKEEGKEEEIPKEIPEASPYPILK